MALCPRTHTALQASKFGGVLYPQQLMSVWTQEVELQHRCGGGGGEHTPHGVVLWDVLHLAGQPDVPPVAHLGSLQQYALSLFYYN